MNDSSLKLTVFFEDPFWVGVLERTENGKLSVCKITFGAEPKDGEVWEFLLKHFYQLTFSPPVESIPKSQAANPKRIQRQVRKESQCVGVGTKAQQALQLQREAHKLERKMQSREQREAEKQRRFELRQHKRKAKHRGR
ncbi:MAG TPA: DUF2992 domain-containing protein [Ruminococcaceae bacterium]|nr:DUF2992 domain-containing protein [Oscillospiraceae bacterium]